MYQRETCIPSVQAIAGRQFSPRYGQSRGTSNSGFESCLMFQSSPFWCVETAPFSPARAYLVHKFAGGWSGEKG